MVIAAPSQAPARPSRRRITSAIRPARQRSTNGVTWPRQRLLETEPGEFSYPAIIQTADGRLHVVYTHRRTTIQHAVMDVEWIIG